MEFDKSKVYTALNADESLIGAKGYFAESLCGLIRLVKSDYPPEHKVQCIEYDCIIADDCDVKFNFFYLVEPAPEKWYVTHTSYDDKLNITEKGLASDTKFTGTKEECEKFISEHSKPKYRPFKDCAELIETWCNLVQKKCDPYREENYSKNTLALPIIWVKNDDGHRFLISYFGKENVIADGNIDMDLLFEEYSFLDGSVCGVVA